RQRDQERRVSRPPRIDLPGAASRNSTALTTNALSQPGEHRLRRDGPGMPGFELRQAPVQLVEPVLFPRRPVHSCRLLQALEQATGQLLTHPLISRQGAAAALRVPREPRRTLTSSARTSHRAWSADSQTSKSPGERANACDA